MLREGRGDKDGKEMSLDLGVSSSLVTSSRFQESRGRKPEQGVGLRKWDDEWLHFSFRKFGREKEERTGS